MPNAVVALRRTPTSLPSDVCWTLRHTTISGLRLLSPRLPRAFSKRRSISPRRQSKSERHFLKVRLRTARRKVAGKTAELSRARTLPPVAALKRRQPSQIAAHSREPGTRFPAPSSRDAPIHMPAPGASIFGQDETRQSVDTAKRWCDIGARFLR